MTLIESGRVYRCDGCRRNRTSLRLPLYDVPCCSYECAELIASREPAEVPAA